MSVPFLLNVYMSIEVGRNKEVRPYFYIVFHAFYCVAKWTWNLGAPHPLLHVWHLLSSQSSNAYLPRAYDPYLCGARCLIIMSFYYNLFCFERWLYLGTRLSLGIVVHASWVSCYNCSIWIFHPCGGFYRQVDLLVSDVLSHEVCFSGVASTSICWRG